LCVEKAAAGRGGRGEVRLITESHQRIDLGDDAALFCKGCEGTRYPISPELRANRIVSFIWGM
jgi:hypothetical protein